MVELQHRNNLKISEGERALAKDDSLSSSRVEPDFIPQADHLRSAVFHFFKRTPPKRYSFAMLDAERQVKPCMRLLGKINALILKTLIFISFCLSLRLQGL